MYRLTVMKSYMLTFHASLSGGHQFQSQRIEFVFRFQYALGQIIF